MRALRLLTLCIACACASHSSAKDETAILRLLHEQRDAWNAGDIDSFMALGYWRSDDLLFISGDNEHRGYDAVLARYRARYTEGDAEMGQLSFTQLLVTEIARDEATVTGRWDLDFNQSEDAGGHFTLTLAHLPVGWRITRDQTSSE